MVVYEIKDPAAVVTTARPKPLRTDLEPTVAVQHSRAIGKLFSQPEQGKGKERKHGRQAVPLGQAAMREIRHLVEQINRQLEVQGIMIHLVLVADEAGFAIDLYDCSEASVCRSIHDISLGVNDLPILLAHLSQKTGIMVDTVS